MENKIYAGERLRRLRMARGMTQARLAVMLRLSPSYLNQIERDQRPLPREVLNRLCALLDVAPDYFAESDELRRLGDLREALANPVPGAEPVELAEAHAALRAAPGVAARFLALHRAYRALEEEHRALRARLADDGPAGPASRLPYDEVQDWVQSCLNHFPALDEAAERLFESGGFSAQTLRTDLERHLQVRHGIAVAETLREGPDSGVLWRLDRAAGRLLLAEEVAPESRLFYMAHVVGLLEQEGAIDRMVAGAPLSGADARALARVGLANYYAGALMLPYRRFRAAARELRHDVERMQRRFGASFEQVCHRLSTLQRPGEEGVPFYFLKVDVAGNVSKRSSATRFHFALFGGACPLWNVHQAFAQPGRILVQLARTPDGSTYLCMARMVGGGGGYLSLPREGAVGLGCDIAHAGELVYATGLALDDRQAPVPIGPGCRACERADCRHRAMPPAGHRLDVGTAERGLLPYRIARPGSPGT
ncbi:helix-turn-helix domain-containing protein [Teichococcus oryzae]|uniref:Helix-turn-helix domain-containing protein n=1 Tax=Teichococcus oryzae TaxID=1608942 RepID=A0A5B2TIG9_9PROT|nr:short-chain fatty acyl-CoA regulator family protein [Pseudoroseomonas oryzae]KAA2213989.1 helix-turn-helix domain-containing protein [Pseudoroseomonas oryzae]